MRFRFWPTALLAATLSPAAALAAAHADITITGPGDVDLSLAVDTNTARFTYQFLTVDFDPLQTVTRTFSYTVRVADDGLPATRTTTTCTPDYLSDCGPPATGFEQAYALIEIGWDHRQVDQNDAFLSDAGAVQSFQSVTGSPQTFSGTLTYTGTDTSQFIPQEVTLQVMLFALADVSPVPEPEGWGLAALGLLPLLARARRRDVSRSGHAS